MAREGRQPAAADAPELRAAVRVNRYSPTAPAMAVGVKEHGLNEKRRLHVSRQSGHPEAPLYHLAHTAPLQRQRRWHPMKNAIATAPQA